MYEIFPANILEIVNISLYENTNYDKLYSIDFHNENWNLMLYKYNLSKTFMFNNIIINKRNLILNANHYGIIKMKSNLSILGFFHINNEDKLDGFMEFNHRQFHLITVDNNSIILILSVKEQIIFDENQFRNQFIKLSKKRLISGRNCLMKVIIGPYAYEILPKGFVFHSIIEKLFYITSYINNIFEEVNQIYSKLPKNLRIKFYVKELFILTPKVCGNLSGVLWLLPYKTLCNKTATEDDIIESFTEINYSNQFCLSSAIINHTTFADTLGYAYMGSMCVYTENYRTFLVNIASVDVLINAQATSITMAHEIGHNIDAEHDDKTSCFSEDVRYIMSAEYDNPRPEFSNCSIYKMETYISAFNQSCFDNRLQQSFCGNGVLEESEECDCGDIPVCRCCDTNTCLLKSVAECSRYGKYGMCCNELTCKFKSRKSNITCALETECGNKKFCNENIGCALDQDTENKILCAKQTNMCDNSLCNNSICSLWNLLEYPSEKISNITCQLHCFDNQSGIYYKLFHLPAIEKLRKIDLTKIVYLIGSNCINPSEFCDSIGVCVSLQGELSDIISISLMFSPNFYELLFLNIQNKSVLIILGFILFSIFIIGIFQLPFLKEGITIYKFLFQYFSNQKKMISIVNYRYYRWFLVNKTIRLNYSKDEIQMAFKEILAIENMRYCFNYLERKQIFFPIKGNLMKIDYSEIIEEFRNHSNI